MCSPDGERGFLEGHGELVQVELEALDPNDLRALLSGELAALIDDDLVEAEREREDEERLRLVALARTFTGGAT